MRDSIFSDKRSLRSYRCHPNLGAFSELCIFFFFLLLIRGTFVDVDILFRWHLF